MRFAYNPFILKMFFSFGKALLKLALAWDFLSFREKILKYSYFCSQALPSAAPSKILFLILTLFRTYGRSIYL